MKFLLFRLAGPVVACGLLSTVCAFGDINITVNNPSFEILPTGGLTNGCGAGCFFSAGAAIPGWNATGQSGQLQPGTQVGNTNFFTSLDQGITGAYSNGGVITQTVGTTVTAGVTYVLSVDIGNREDVGNPGTAELLINGNDYFIQPDPVTNPPAKGEWATYEATYTGLAADAGDAITIQLSGVGVRGDFDNIVLTELGSTATPEPSFLILTGIGLAGMSVLALRKRASMRN